MLATFRRMRRGHHTAYEDELVERFGAELTRPVASLSKGNKQKLGLVLAFMHRPRLLVLDEPTSGLDPLLQDEFASLLRETVADGRTVLLSSHDLDEVQRVVQRVAIIRSGRIVVDDTVASLRASAPRTIELTFDHDVDARPLASVPGVTLHVTTARHVTLTHTGAAAPVLTAIAPLQPDTITARPADLEELFLRLYGGTTHAVDLIRLDLRLRRRMLIGTAVGAAAYLFLVVAVYPTFKHDTAFDDMIAANPAAAAAFGITGSITSPEGWLSANMYANFGPLLALMLTIGYGSAAIAGQDGDGLLGLLATLPVPRARIVAAKALTLLVAALVVPVVSYAVCLTGPQFELNPRWGPLLGVSVALTLLAFDLGAIALLVGAISGSRGAAMGAAERDRRQRLPDQLPVTGRRGGAPGPVALTLPLGGG